ncbi:MAG: DUF4352 domain-containing protein [Desulfosporosinus sp.]
MRKLMSVLFIIGIFLITGCSNFPKPESTVSDFIDAGKKFDLTKMATMVNPSNSSSKEKISDLMNDKKNNNQYQKYFLDYFKENAAKITYTVKETKIENDKATVTVDFKYVNGGPLLKATLGDVFSKAISLAFTGVQMNDEEMGQMFVSAMQKQKETVKDSFVEKSIDLKLTKVENKWYIDEPSVELLDVFLSNFNSVAKEFNNAMNPSSSDVNQKPTTLMEQAKKDNMTIISKNIGDEIQFATLKLKVNRVEEKQTINAQYSSPKTAKEGAKFVIVNADLINTTNKAFTMSPNLTIVDNKDREFKTYSDTIGAIDDYLDYKELSPSIKVTGNWVYELPTDATSYKLISGKSGTNELYEILLK